MNSPNVAIRTTNMRDDSGPPMDGKQLTANLLLEPFYLPVFQPRNTECFEPMIIRPGGAATSRVVIDS